MQPPAPTPQPSGSGHTSPLQDDTPAGRHASPPQDNAPSSHALPPQDNAPAGRSWQPQDNTSAGRSSQPQDSRPRHPQPQPDSFTGRFPDVQSVLGEKREVEGKYAHHIDGGKATRLEAVLHPPPLQLSQKYEKEIKPPRKKYLQKLAQPTQKETQPPQKETQPTQTETQPVHPHVVLAAPSNMIRPPKRPLPRPPTQALGRNRSSGRITTRRGPPPQSSGAPATPTYRLNLPPASVPQVADVGFLDLDVIAAVKRAGYDWHGEQGIMDDNGAYETWLKLSQDERRCVLEYYNHVQRGSTSQHQPSAQQTRVLDQLLMDVDYMHQTSTQACAPQQPPLLAASGVTWRAQSTDGPAGAPGSMCAHQYRPPADPFADVHDPMDADPLEPPPVASDFGGGYSVPIQPSQPHGAPPSQGFVGAPGSMHAEPSQGFVGASGSMHAEPSQPLPHVPEFGGAYSVPIQPSQPRGVPPSQGFVGAHGSMHADPPQPPTRPSDYGGAYSVPTQPSQPRGAPPSQGFVGASGSMHAAPPQPTPLASDFGGAYSVPTQPSQPHGAPPSQGFVGAHGSMHVDPPQPPTRPSDYGGVHSVPTQPSQPRGVPPSQGFVGASGSMHAAPPQPTPLASDFGGAYSVPTQPSQPRGAPGSMYADPPQPPAQASDYGGMHSVPIQPPQVHGAPPSQGFLGASGFMHADPAQPTPHRGVPPNESFAGVDDSMDAEPSQPTPRASDFGGGYYVPTQPSQVVGMSSSTYSGPPQPRAHSSVDRMSPSLHAPAPQQSVNMSDLMLGALQEQQQGPGGSIMSTTPSGSPRRVSAHQRSDHTLPFPDDIDMGVSLDKGKGRADAPRPGHKGMALEQRYNPPQSYGHQPRPRLPFMEGLQGDVSGHLNPNTTLLFVQQLRGLASAIEDQTQEFRDFRERIEPLVNVQNPLTSTNLTTSPTDIRGATSAGRREARLQQVSWRMQQREKRIESRVTRLRGAKTTTADSDSEEDVALNDGKLREHLNRLRARMRRTFEEMLQITDWDDVYHLLPALTPEELALYKARDVSIVPTATNFRIDFSLGWKKPFNKEAREVYIDRYLERIENGAYAKHPTPPQLLTRDRIGDILDKQMPNYRQKWRRSKTPLSAEKKKKLARAACQHSRRRTLHESRETLLVRRGYAHHVRFFKLLEPVNMSGDETDGEMKTHPPKWRILVARWQSAELKNFLWEIDRMYRDDWGHPPLKRATGGNPPRDRVLRPEHFEDGVAPIGLWRNCYDPTWLQAQPPYIINELEIVDEDYDFKL